MVSGQFLATIVLFPGKEPLVPTNHEAGRTRHAVWRFWRREQYFTLTGNRTTITRFTRTRFNQYTGYAISARL